MISPKLLYHGTENNLKLNIVVSISRFLYHKVFGGVGLRIILYPYSLPCRMGCRDCFFVLSGNETRDLSNDEP